VEDHPHNVIMDFNASNEGADQITLHGPVGSHQSVLEEAGECLQLADHQLEAPGLLRRLLDRGDLRFQLGGTTTQLGQPRLELPFLDQPLGVAVDQSANALAP
jgi:hypothetical protein